MWSTRTDGNGSHYNTGNGFPKRKIHKESFCTAIKTISNSAKALQEHQITIVSKGKKHKVNVSAGTLILFAGLELGIDIPYSCQSGSCISCVGKCLAGKVEMLTTKGLTEEQVKNGYVLTCVGYPKSDNVEIEFN